MSDPTIEDVLRNGNRTSPLGIVDVLHTATVDGPLRSEDGMLVVHRADPELAAELLEEARVAEGWCEDMESPEVRRLADLLRRAAAMLAGELEEES